MKAAFEWGERIPIGIIYRNDRAPFEEHVPVLNQGPLVGRPVDRAMLRQLMNEFA
jgi:2-oxoglutarate ferredoxin oxidoreductase subunit beta